MKAVYTLPIRSGITVPVHPGTLGLTIGKVSVGWKTDQENNLEAVVIEFTGIGITYTQEGSIVSAPEGLQEQAYRLASYLANRLYVQTSFDALDPELILLGTPTVSPENPIEEETFKTTPKRVWTSIKLGCAIRGLFKPSVYGTGIDHSAAYGYFADAQRVSSVFQKFELLYKVVEYFFPEDGPKLDKAVSLYAMPYDATFTADAVEHLRILRNRCIHPRARRGHVNAQNISHINEVRAKLPQMIKLASLLLDHPTF